MVWAVVIVGGNVPILGPWAKTAPFRKAVLFNRQILAKAELGLIWTDYTCYEHEWSSIFGW
jgi:hypothetical protein